MMTSLRRVMGKFKMRNYEYTIVLFVLFAFYFIYLIAPSFVVSNTTSLHNDLKIEMRIKDDDKIIQQNHLMHMALWEEFFVRRITWETSILGGILFKNDDIPSQRDRAYVVLVWKYWTWLKRRHANGFGNKPRHPLKKCSVKNCIFIGDDKRLDSVDAVLVHLQRGEIPNVKRRNPRQRWIFLDDESPKNAFSLASKKVNWKDLSNVFNWSMSYRADADVPVPYGRTIPLNKPIIPDLRPAEVAALVPNWKTKRRDTIVTVLMSNCGVKSRNNFIIELKNYTNVDVYGGCSDDKRLKFICPGHYKSDCQNISEYLFYLVLENSNCEQYLTEKVFYHAYSKGAIPVIMGPSLTDCKALLPPNSFLHVDQFESIELLATTIKYLAKNDNLLLAFHSWRNSFQVLNEHGYFGSESFHLCRLCEALNYNDESTKIYSEKDLARFFDTSLMCYK